MDKDLVVALLERCKYPYRERKAVGQVPTKWSGLIEAHIFDGPLFFFFVDDELVVMKREPLTIIADFEKEA